MPGGWQARLALRYRHEGGRTVAHDRHEGPLRVLKPLHPEGPAVCHHVIVHPPGGIVGGDRLEVDVAVGEGAHALVTTPGATRFYRSDGATAVQSVRLALAPGARLEWLPLETLAYSGCIAENRLRFELAPGAGMLGWDVLVLGLPAAAQPFEAGRFGTELAWAGPDGRLRWLERGRLAADEPRLLRSPLGLGGRPVVATLWWAGADALPAPRRERMLEAGRAALEAADAGADTVSAGLSAPHDRLVVLRVLAGRVEPAMTLLRAVRAAWRAEVWGLPEATPRVWRT